MTTTTEIDTWHEQWLRWHDERVEDATSPYGIAAAVSTRWLGADARSFPEIPGQWSPSDRGVVGTGLPVDAVATLGPGFQTRVDHDGQVEIGYGEEIQIGELRIRPFVRVGDVALRVTSPSDPSLLSPVSASATPSMAASAPAPPPSVPVTNPGSRAVTISWPASENRDAPPTPRTPGVSQR